MTKAVIIGGGIGGLATSILVRKAGYEVELYDQLSSMGGRARQFKAHGFTFDMGPSWYLMPGVFEHYFKLIGEDIHDHLRLTRLKPAYKVFFEKHAPLTVQGDLATDAEMFERIEAGAGTALRRYVDRAGKTYRTAVDSFLYTNFDRYTGLVRPDILASAPFMLKTALQPLDRYVSSYFTDIRLRQIMEYPMVFLGASPYEAPALYHLMSYMDFEEGVYYPEGGIHTVIEALIRIAEQNGVKLHSSTTIKAIAVHKGKASGVTLHDGRTVSADIVISNADVHHTETKLLPAEHRSYPESYWQKRQNGPSALLMYLGVKGSMPQLEHHNLFFADDWRKNFQDIFKDKSWPQPASMYVCKPGATDPGVAPKGHENLFVLVPLPARLANEKEQTALVDQYFDQLMSIIDAPDLRERIVYQRIFGPADFSHDYNSWQGSALGISHTLRQSAFFRPRNKSKKVEDLYYVGGNTIPGVGLPMCLIGAELVYKHIIGDTSNEPRKQL